MRDSDAIGRISIRPLQALLGVWFAASSLVGQTRIAFDRIGRNEGLSQSAVLCLTQDHEGYLWVGTEDGLNRYDGYDFRVFHAKAEDPNALADDYINAVIPGPAGDLWIGTRSGGLYVYRPTTGALEQIPFPGRAPPEIHAMIFDKDGRLWIGTHEGLFRFDIQRNQVVQFQAGGQDGLADNRVLCLAEDADAYIWIGTLQGLDRLDPATGSLRHFTAQPGDLNSLPGDRILSLLSADEGVWVGTDKGLAQIRLRSLQCRRIALEPPGSVEDIYFEIQALALGRERRLWVGTNAGLVALNLASGRFRRYRQDASDPKSLAHDQVRAVHEDAEGVLFVGTWGGSLSRYDRNREKFGLVRHSPDDPTSLSSDHIWCFLEEADGTLWVGTEGGGLSRRNPGQESFQTYSYRTGQRDALSSTNIHAIAAVDQAHLWLGTFSGVDVFDKDSGRVVAHYQHDPNRGDSLSDDSIWTLFKDSRGRIWVGTEHGGLNRFRPESASFQSFANEPARPESLAHNWVMTLSEDRQGQLWVGSFGGGVHQLLDADRGRFKIWSHDPKRPESLSNNNISCILQDPLRDGLWIATFGGGLNYLDPDSGRITRYQTAQGMPDDNLYGILPDARKRLWISTNNGLLCFDPASDEKRVYTVADGLQDNEFNSGAFFRGPSGTLYFGGLMGFNGFNPKNLVAHQGAPKVALTGFLRNNKLVQPRLNDAKSPLSHPIEHTDELSLTYLDKVISLRFAALHYANPLKNRFAYKLEGFDDTWIETDAGNRLATFTALDPGTYVFRVKAANCDGVWNESGTSLTLRISPPPWGTWWARSLFALLLILAIALYLVGQRRRLEKARALSERLTLVDRLRDDFLANTSHELRTPLNGIIGLTESLVDGAQGPVPEGLKRNLLMIITSGRRLKALVDDILDFSKLKHDSLTLNRRAVSLHPLVDIVYTMCAPMLRGKNVALRNEIAEDLPAAFADENRLQQIFYNVIGNAVRFTDSGHVSTHARLEDGLLHVTVSDTGIGIPLESQEHVFDSFVQAQNADNRGGTGLGLALTRRLVELHGGTISLDSHPGRGTRVHFSLPYTNDRPSAAEEPAQLARVEVQPESEEPAGGELGHKPLPIVAGGNFHLLLVDDEPINLQVLVNHLGAYPCRLTTARGGREALELLEQIGSIDLVLLDIMMPGLSGYETCRLIRANEAFRHLPVIFLTARNQVGDLVQAFETGANDYLTKPVARAELLARVGLHLQQMVQKRTLAEMHREQETLNRIVMEINRETHLENLLDAMLEQGLAHFSAGETATIFLWNEDKNAFQIVASRGYDLERLRDLTFSYDELVSRYIGQGKAFEEGVTQVNQIRNIVPMEKLAGFDTPSSMLVMPLAPDGKLEGFLVLDNLHDSEAFDEADVRQLNRFREHAVLALAKLKLVKLLSEKNQAILAAQEQLVLQEKMASIGFLAAGISHEIKNPTSYMLLSMQNLDRELQKFHDFLFQLMESDADTEITQAIQARFDTLTSLSATMQEGAERVGVIVRDLGGFARKSDEREWVDLAPHLISTANLVQSNFRERVTIDCVLDTQLKLYCNASQLNQVFMNLIVNGCQAIVAVRKDGLLEIRARVDADGVTLTFRDNGCGIPAAKRERIFEPFFTTKPTGEGTGLGLAISRTIIHDHGGRLEVSSEEGVGSCFSLWLPA